jgi:hypothetical protein
MKGTIVGHALVIQDKNTLDAEHAEHAEKNAESEKDRDVESSLCEFRVFSG